MIKLDKVHGVGGLTIMPQGQGTIKLKSSIDGQTFIIILNNVLYILENKHNLILLSKWDRSGGIYEGGNGEMFMMKDGLRIACGRLVGSNLYQLELIGKKKKHI